MTHANKRQSWMQTQNAPGQVHPIEKMLVAGF
jgi:hypothetical protein